MLNDEDLKIVERFIEMLLPKDKDVLLLIQPYNIGDVIISGALADALRKQKKKRAVKFVILDRFRTLNISFKGVESVEFLSRSIMDNIVVYMWQTGRYETDSYFYGHFRKNAEEAKKAGFTGLIKDDNLDFVEAYKKDVFNFPLDTPFSPFVVNPPSNEEIRLIEKTYKINKNTVLLAPYANSMAGLPPLFWEKCAEILKEKGFTVYTNIAGNEIPVQGTQGFNASFSALFEFAPKFRAVVGLRSGIFDFLAFSKTKLLCICYYPNWNNDLSIIFPESDCKTFYDALPFLSPIEDYLGNKKVSMTISFSHEKIPQQPFCSYDELIKAIVDNV